jgi:outer membrane lipoprotein SlyB
MYQDFVERLMSQLALQGTEITNKKMEDEKSRMDVKYIDEVGKMFITVDGENVKVVYEVQRDRKEVKRGLRGALAGGGIGGLLGGVLRKSDDVKDRVVDTVSGAIAGGAYEAYEGYEESKEEKTRFAKELAGAVKDVEDQLQYIIRGQKAASESLKEKARKKIDAETETDKKIMLEIEDVFADVLSVKEEVELADMEGKDIKKSKVRVERAEKLLKDARSALEKRDYMMAKGKMRAAKSMVQKAKDLL